MAKLYYRGMAAENGKPKIGRSAKLLGVRLGRDIDIEQMPAGYLNKQGYLLPQSERQFAGELVDVAIGGRKGLSVFLSIESLPAFRRPAKFGGSGKDPLWQIDDKNIRGDLEALQDSPTHVSIVPSVTMSLERYEAALANTQNDWERID
ncbi:hypothetical protein J0895_13335 [Phormidium pseudopriestleyi FRX01]|uniref:Tse2 ADP-ribosyltransferase toxin domain-containing protein n=1 Tax=Phormidium pseudopriestleyi FRX01 TaxID=1759528 RepID=A0ABS3FSH9_9CYAN|nr:hypothetical protein [Phormidium pseudopriestleyi]MBO0350077.1 hypothetical protein [Phormidium pseudopriestleyi FRX01]